MGIKNFFKKVWGGIKKAGRFVRDKVFPVVGRIAKPILNVIGALPGKIGMIGKIGSGVASVLHETTNKIPNEQVRDKINGAISNVHEGFHKVVDRGKDFADAANRGIGVGKDIIDTAKRGYDIHVKPYVPTKILQ